MDYNYSYCVTLVTYLTLPVHRGVVIPGGRYIGRSYCQAFETFLFRAQYTSFHSIIISVFSSIALSNQNYIDHRRMKIAISIQYGYRKCGTHARIYSRTLAHRNKMI